MSILKTAAFTMLSIAAIGAAPVTAQTLSYAGEQTVDIARAEELERQALQTARNSDRAGKAARLFRKAASLRPLGDPIAVYDLQTAGQLYFYAQDVRAARSATREAAEAAIAIGDVVNAAHLLVDVTHLSIDLQDGDTAREALGRAVLLSTSPALSNEQRAALELRLQTTDRVVVAAGDR